MVAAEDYLKCQMAVVIIFSFGHRNYLVVPTQVFCWWGKDETKRRRFCHTRLLEHLLHTLKKCWRQITSGQITRVSQTFLEFGTLTQWPDLRGSGVNIFIKCVEQMQELCQKMAALRSALFRLQKNCPINLSANKFDVQRKYACSQPSFFRDCRSAQLMIDSIWSILSELRFFLACFGHHYCIIVVTASSVSLFRSIE